MLLLIENSFKNEVIVIPNPNEGMQGEMTIACTIM